MSRRRGSTQVVKPRTGMDQALALRAHDLIWRETPDFVRTLLRLALHWKKIALDPESGKDDVLAASREYRAIADMFVSRTVPTLERIDFHAALLALGGDAADQDDRYSEEMRVGTLKLVERVREEARR